nr:hypothetical protein BgiMline_010429 [Biomphalaria glabrata]
MLHPAVQFRCYTPLFNSDATPRCSTQMLHPAVQLRCYTLLFNSDVTPCCSTQMLHPAVQLKYYTLLFNRIQIKEEEMLSKMTLYFLMLQKLLSVNETCLTPFALTQNKKTLTHCSEQRNANAR